MAAVLAASCAALAACNALFGVEPGELASAAAGAGGAGGQGGAGGSAASTGGGGAGPACGAPAGERSGTLEWVRGSTASAYAMARGVALGASGAVVVAGDYQQDALQIGSDVLPFATDDFDDAFIATFDGETGSPVWARGFSAPGEQSADAVAADPASGEIVVGGAFFGPFSLDDGATTLPYAGNQDMANAFVARFGPAGSPLWSRAFGAEDDVRTVAVATAPSGESVALLLGFGKIDLGDAVRGNQGEMGVYLVKLDASGATEWSRYFQSSYYFGYESGLAVDGGGDIVITGDATGASTFGATEPFRGETDVFVMKLDASGKKLWSRLFGGTGHDSANGAQWGTAVALDCAGDVLLTGVFEKDLQMGSLPVLVAHDDAPYQGDIFVAKLRGSDGEPLWANGYGDFGLQLPRAVSADSRLDVLVSGILYDTPESTGVDLGGGTALPPSGSDAGDYREDLFLAKYDGSGHHVWSARIGDPFIQEGKAVLRPDGEAVVAGDYYFDIDLDGTPKGVLTDDQRDMFVATFSP